MSSTGIAGVRSVRRDGVGGGLGAVAFAVLSLVQLLIVNAPGGGYSASTVTRFLTSGHRTTVIVVFHLATLGVLGLVAFVAGLRETVVRVAGDRSASVVSGLGTAAAASFAIGWAVNVGQALAHTEGGPQVVVPAPVTHLISQIGVTLVFGSGAILLGLALLAFARSARTVLSRTMRVALVSAGLAGFAGLAFFTFFLQLLLLAGIGVAMLARGQLATVSRSPEASPSEAREWTTSIP